MGRKGQVPANLAKARPLGVEANINNAARRATEDPVKLDRAMRLVRFAIESGKITLADVTPAEADPGQVSA